MGANFEVSEISFKNRNQNDVLEDHLWGTLYFMFPFYVLTRTENTILYAFLIGFLLLCGIGSFKYVLPLMFRAGSLISSKVFV